MIVRESWAVCSGCPQREPGEEYPATWIVVQGLDAPESGPSGFCSRACLARYVYGGAAAVGAALPLPFGMTEYDVAAISLLARGCSNKEIARQFGVSDRTVKNRLARLFEKIGVYSRLQAVLCAHAVGLLNLDSEAETLLSRLRGGEPIWADDVLGAPHSRRARAWRALGGQADAGAPLARADPPRPAPEAYAQPRAGRHKTPGGDQSYATV